MFWFSLVVRRSTLTRDAILSEPEVSSVGKFRFFRLGPSVIEPTVLETSSTDDVTIAYIYIYIRRVLLPRRRRNPIAVNGLGLLFPYEGGKDGVLLCC